MRDPASLPKAELHIHLEGSIRPGTVRELADRSGRPAPSGLTGDRWRFAGFADFIAQYVATCSLLTELDDFHRIAREICEDEARSGVRYAEVVFSPSNHAERLHGDWFGPIEAVLDGLE
ncbi:MAG: adenosine deaminase, partial [Gemmatimonadota bacterium]